MHLFLSYAKSHIYDLHAILVALATIAAMFYIKAPIKQRNEERVDRKLEKSPALAGKRRQYLKHANMVLIPIAMAVAFVLFFLASLVSPLIHFSLETAIMSGVYSLAGYALWDQMMCGVKR